MQKTTAQIEKQSTALEKLEKRQQSRIKAAAIAGIASGVSSWTSSKAATMRQGAGHAINTAMSEEDAMQGLIRQVGSLKIQTAASTTPKSPKSALKSKN